MSAILKALLAQLIKAVTTNMGGFQGWIVKKILQYGGQALLDNLDELWKRLAREKLQKEAEKEKNKVIENPNSTPEERGEAYEKYINAGRK